MADAGAGRREGGAAFDATETVGVAERSLGMGRQRGDITAKAT